MIKYRIRDAKEGMVCFYEVEGNTEKQALNKYVNELAGSLELINYYYDSGVEDVVEVSGLCADEKDYDSWTGCPLN